LRSVNCHSSTRYSALAVVVSPESESREEGSRVRRLATS